MEKITSFTIDHIKLQPGLYVSRKDKVGSETVTTFDLRVTNPNEEPVMNTAEIHTMEHLAATYLRNEPDSICCWPVTTFPRKWYLWCWIASDLSGISGAKCPAHPPRIAATIWI